MSICVYKFEGVTPIIHHDTYIHPSAVIIGNVVVESQCYIGPLASLRGDLGSIYLCSGAVIQERCVLHSALRENVLIEEEGHVGHGAVLHGCLIRSGAAVGMGSMVMSGAEVGERSILAAHSFVRARVTLPAESLFSGNPARLVRALSQEEMTRKLERAELYRQLSRGRLEGMVACPPLNFFG